MKRAIIFLSSLLISTAMLANHPTPYMQKGASLIAKGKYKEAVAQFDKVIGKWCEYGAAYDYRCYCNIQLGNIDAAVDDLVRALRTGREREKSMEMFDRLSAMATEKVIEALLEECAVNPLRRNLHYYLGLACQMAGDMDKAAEAFAESSKEYGGYKVRARLYTPSFFRSSDPDEFGNWTRTQMRYPDIAKANEYDGSVKCSFWIDEEGNVKDIRVVEDVHYDMDSQLVGVIEKSPLWTPATADTEPVRSFHTFTMNYILN